MPDAPRRQVVTRSVRALIVENPRDGADAILHFLSEHPIKPR
jgi:hypothetical protein